MSALTSPKTAKSTREKDKQEVKVFSKKNELQVFLGGSCNPTTWRQNLAIPYLEMNGISYYNPQVDNWTPEVVELEHRAKQNAKILLFVIDDQTRATVTLIESAFLAGDDKNIVFVFYPFESEMICLSEQSIEAYNLYETKQKMMKGSLTTAKNKVSMVRTASSQTSSSLTNSSTTAISRVEPQALKSIKASSCTSKSSFASSKLETKDEGLGGVGIGIERTQELARLDSCSLRLAGEEISVEEFRELKKARLILKNLIDMRKIPTFPDIPQALNHISCRFRGTISHQESLEKSSWCDNEPFSSDIQLRQNLTESDRYIRGHNDKSIIRDVYLSIDSDDCTIMNSTVIPMLEENGLSYSYMPMKKVDNQLKSIDGLSLGPAQTIQFKGDRVAPRDEGDEKTREDYKASKSLPGLIDKAELAIEREMYAIRTSKVLLFVITNKCRGLSIMVLASHFMALLRENVVLCVQYLEEPCTIRGEQLSKSAIADYNRGRVYLCDDAVKSQVPVFSTIREAIECCSRKCQHME